MPVARHQFADFVLEQGESGPEARPAVVVPGGLGTGRRPGEALDELLAGLAATGTEVGDLVFGHVEIPDLLTYPS
jgi:hypothetical protein